ncbi:replicative DNA helicase [Rodentibacter caecimuris]|uniref:Replicative DNA helicase n=1 Tax=Rodentibacter caecimuris TaxID=1796644 RepID=A0A1V3KN90_9PAST|nr:replicative DNA helicase [Rodentibacter heylii]OOF78808.1 replicative DNA helicase [Rodentibacter heylii]
MNQKPPIICNIEAEQSVIGGLLLDNNKWDELSSIVTADNFYLGHHRLMFTVIGQLLMNNEPADMVTVEHALKQQNWLEECGGLAYLAEITNKTPSAANVEAYAKIVRTDSQARQLYALGDFLRKETGKVNSQDSLDALISNVEKRLTELTLNRSDKETNVNLSEVLNLVITRMDESKKNLSPVTGTSFGIDRLDVNTTGSQAGDLILLAARPSMGKTALSLTFAKAALEQKEGSTVQYYSLEMPAEQIMQRFLALLARVPLQRIRQAIQIDETEWARIGNAFGMIAHQWKDRLLLDDNSYLTPQLLRTKVRRNVRKYGIPSVIIIDYLQLMSDPTYKDGKNRNLEISSISTQLKQLAKEIGCPIIALSQLNRNLEQRADKRPISSDLRDSGSLEQDADMIFFIYRDEVYNDNTEMPGIAEIIIAKQRNGPIGTVLSQFRGELSLFENIPDEEYERLARL